MEPVAIVFVVLIVIAIGVLMVVWQFSCSGTTLEQWAAENGYELLSTERRFIRRGPYFLTTSKGQEVFFITVRDVEGNILRGWARVGGFMVGQFSDRVSVRWMN